MRLYFSFFLFIIGISSYSQTQIRILSYNIYHGELPYKKGQPNLDSVAQFIKGVQPDFVACQEVDSSTGRSTLYYGQKIDFIKELAAKTGMYGYFGKAMDYDGGGYGEGLLSSNPLHAKVVLLPNPAGGEPRSLIYAETTLKNGQKLTIGGTHLCHQFDENKAAQVTHINALFGNSLTPAIVCGDFNFESTEAPYPIMLKQWKDAAVIKGDPQNTFSSDKPGKRIDYAFVSKTATWKIVDVEVFPVNYSDHMPVLFVIELVK